MTVPLGDVGGVEPRVTDSDENVVTRRSRRRPLLEGEDLVAACTGVDDRAHVPAERMRRGWGAADSVRPQGFAPVPAPISEVHVLAAVCARLSKDEPLTGLELREIPEPVAADGGVTRRLTGSGPVGRQSPPNQGPGPFLSGRVT